MRYAWGKRKGEKMITNDEEHESAVKRIRELMGAEPGSTDEEELSRLADQVVAYEEERWPMGDEVLADLRALKCADQSHRSGLAGGLNRLMKAIGFPSY